MAKTPGSTRTRSTTTRSRATTSKRSATATKTATKKAPAAKTVKPVVVKEAEPVVTLPDFKKTDLIEAVVERSGVKKRFAKPAIEAALAILGETLAAERDLNLQPMGKVKIQRSKEKGGAKVLTARIRQSAQKVKDSKSDSTGEPPAKTPTAPLADAAE
ncbi:HU family DNA-binding protein [Shimia biformata]|uniref:HU family DNA-binding protein n=1 Tax=Shimia biformata TaxID=1294299 RepID=UPI001EF2B7F8|nr:HU family DNA-binding protein [Shimia biformata]